jgi:hypothetical protein
MYCYTSSDIVKVYITLTALLWNIHILILKKMGDGRFSFASSW